MRSPFSLSLVVLVAVAAGIAPRAALAQSVSSGSATTQSLAFTTIAQSVIGGPANSTQQVIQNDSDYSAFFNGNPPASPTVDFTTEDVIAVAQGTKPTGGYSISIDQIDYDPSSGTATVNVREMTPTPHQIVNMMVTTPFHVVKLAKQASSYTFASSVRHSAGGTFEQITVSYHGGFISFSSTYTIAKDGTFTVTRHPVWANSGDQVWTDQATKAELDAVKQAFSNADVSTLPATIQATRRIPDIGVTSVQTEMNNGQTYSTSTQMGGDFAGYASRLGPLVSAIDAIATRVVQGAQGQTITDVVTYDPYAGTLTVGNYTIDPNDPFFGIVSNQDGLTITMKATVNSSTQVATVMSVQGTPWTNLHVRAQANRKSKSLGIVTPNDTLQITGESADQLWYEIDYQGTKAYVYEYYVTVGQ
jgi:hypothetical protein